MSSASALVDSYIDKAVQGERRAAIRLTLDMLDRGTTQEHVIDGLLAAAQREVGERWHRNELTVADEHIATGVSAAALDALVGEARPLDGDGHTVVACAEGDWHSLAAQMFAESLHGLGVGVTVLGASTPADYVADLLVRRHADSLAISCSLPIFFEGVTRLVDAAHRLVIPVIVGGRAFGTDSRRADALGANAWARSARDAVGILHHWSVEPPEINREPAPLDPVAIRLADHSEEIGVGALARLAPRFPPMASYDARQLARTREDVVFNVQILAAALLVADDAVFTDFLDWLHNLLLNRAVPGTALIAGLEALRPGIELVHPAALSLLDEGRRQLVASAG